MADNERYSLKKDNPVALILILVLAVACIAIKLLCVPSSVPYSFILKALTVIMALSVVYYVTVGYRVPHGNHMKYLCLAFAGYVAFSCCTKAFSDTLTLYSALPCFVMAIGAAFMAGRLSKYRKNIAVVVVVAIAALVYWLAVFDDPLFTDASSKLYILTNIDMLIMWLAVSAAYIARYKAHRDAGVQDT